MTGSTPVRVAVNKYEYVKRSVSKRTEWVRTLKDKPCMDCGAILPPHDMHYHHLDPAIKEFRISDGMWRKSRIVILAEIAKCVLICSSCHKARHSSVEERPSSGVS
jgi:hypothetical protein